MRERQQFREVLATLAAKTTTRIPALNGRVAKGVKLALLGDIELHADGSSTVMSSSDPTRRYEIREGTCTCRDWDQAPEHLCQHRLGAGFLRKAQELCPQVGHDGEGPPTVETRQIAQLPEAPASVNVRLTVAGREVQLTLRDTDETRLLARLDTVLQQYPMPLHAIACKPTDERSLPPCPQGHGFLRKGKGGHLYCPTRLADGSWCTGGRA
jgi:hypothetical protein